jgi:hypothetical protein
MKNKEIYKDVKQKYLKEVEDNENEQRFHTGNKVLYGQTIQFRHLASGKFLTIDTRKLSLEFGSCELKLSNGNELCQF